MAIYHCKFSIVGRSSGRSAVAAAAYRAGELLYDEELQKKHDYRKKTEVIYSEIFLPENAPSEYTDRETLWNEVQKIEKASNARFARDICVAIPIELSQEKAEELIKEYCSSLASEGMCVDASIHWKDNNPHAHILCTTRGINKNGTWAAKEKKIYKLDAKGQRIPIIDKKTRTQKVDSRNRKQWERVLVQANDWNKREKLLEWRERWADTCNRYLEPDKHITQKSFEDQGIDLIPTIHEGYVARQIEESGRTSELCEHNREVRRRNSKIIRINEEINRLRSVIKNILKEIAESKSQKEDKADTKNIFNRNLDEAIADARNRATEKKHSVTPKKEVTVPLSDR